MDKTTNKTPAKILQFACDCVSKLHDIIRDPWSHVSRAGLISSETKEIILNKTYRQPKTVSQLAREIGLSQPAVHKHLKELLAGDMLRGVSLSDREKACRVEQYYEPNFPVLLMEDLSKLEPACDKVAQSLAEIFWKHKNGLQAAFYKTSLEKRGYNLEDVLDFFTARYGAGDGKFWMNRDSFPIFLYIRTVHDGFTGRKRSRM
jgi:DNA-binding transcriptional ArsR family regulator